MRQPKRREGACSPGSARWLGANLQIGMKCDCPRLVRGLEVCPFWLLAENTGNGYCGLEAICIFRCLEGTNLVYSALCRAHRSAYYLGRSPCCPSGSNGAPGWAGGCTGDPRGCRGEGSGASRPERRRSPAPAPLPGCRLPGSVMSGLGCCSNISSNHQIFSRFYLLLCPIISVQKAAVCKFYSIF